MQSPTLPGIVFTVIAGLLAVAGVLRVILLGLRPGLAEQTDTEPLSLARRRKVRRYHLIWGLVWVAMGAFLALSTSGVFRSRLRLF